jgi:hypothetical protein
MMHYSKKILFEPFPELEYFDITRDKKTILSLDRETLKQFTGKPYREMQFFVQKVLNEKYSGQYPPSTYNYSAKKVNEAKIYRGMIKTIDISSAPGNKIETKKEINNMSEISELKKIVESIKSDNVSSDMLINITKQGYELQLQFLNGQLKHKEQIIVSLEKDILKLESELDKQDLLIQDFKSKSGLAPMIEMAQKFIMARVSAPQPLQNLSNSDTTDIPQEILNILGAVDYTRIDESSMQKITDTLRQYITLLPLKGN